MMRNLCPERGQQGFTLVELITVMLLVGILAVVVLPRFDLLKGFDEIGYRDKVRATLEYARKAAVGERRNVRVTLAANGLTLTIDNDVPEGAAASTFPRSLALPTPDRACGGATNAICAPTGVTLAGTAALTFTPLGKPNAAAAYTVTGPAPSSSTYAITVAAETGYVQ